MRLADFIRANHAAIEEEWEAFAKTLQPAPGAMSNSELRDHAGEILTAIADDLDAPQSKSEQAGKSKGEGLEHRMSRVGRVHADLRIGFGFKLGQLVAEFRALRATVLRLWAEQAPESGLVDVTRFNEAIDEALSVSTSTFAGTMENYRDQFLGVLGHDLRSPLAAIKALAATLSRDEEVSDKHARLASRIVVSADRMDRMVGDLLDLTRTHLGGGIPVVRAWVDLGLICSAVVDELEGSRPDRPVKVEVKGDLQGEWDGDRLEQVVSNLLGNAIQYGEGAAPVTLTVLGEPDVVRLTVNNQGSLIPPNALPTLFDPLVRHGVPALGRSSSLGLGLYIAREVVISHGGGITVESKPGTGTTFQVTLPRRQAASHAGDNRRPDPGANASAPPKLQ
jgi:signal transduction histidine kinase